jgi:hypothetical protein
MASPLTNALSHPERSLTPSRATSFSHTLYAFHRHGLDASFSHPLAVASLFQLLQANVQVSNFNCAKLQTQ